MVIEGDKDGPKGPKYLCLGTKGTNPELEKLMPDL